MTTSLPANAQAGTDPAMLTIGAVSQRTGIPVAGLRNWENRYGLPRPERTPSGQRRYRESDCTVLTEVLRARARGLSLPAAMASVITRGNAETSVFASLRRRHPGLRVHVMTKKTLLALTWAIEDECCASAQRPVLIGSFQQQRFYRASEPRWADLARGAEQTVVFADFGQARNLPGPIAEIPCPDGSPLRREWTLICDAPDQPACVAGWERPGQQASRDRDRLFEVLWSVDPRVVRSAARIGIGLAGAAGPGLGARLRAQLAEEPSAVSADLRRAGGLLERTLDYLAGEHRTAAS